MLGVVNVCFWGCSKALWFKVYTLISKDDEKKYTNELRHGNEEKKKRIRLGSESSEGNTKP